MRAICFNINRKILCVTKSLYKFDLSLSCVMEPFGLSARDSDDVVSIIRKIYELEGNDLKYKEHCYALFFNQALDLIGYSHIGIGGISSCIVDCKVIFTEALLSRANSISIVHNHPSGTLRASEADLSLKRDIVTISDALGIRMLDFIILTEDSYISV